MVREAKDKASGNKDANPQTQRAQAGDAVGEVGNEGAGQELDETGDAENQAHQRGGGIELFFHVQGKERAQATRDGGAPGNGAAQKGTQSPKGNLSWRWRLVDGAGGGGGRGGRRQRGRAFFGYVAGMVLVLIVVAREDSELYGAWVVLLCPRDGAGVEGGGVRQGGLPLLRVAIREGRHDSGRARARSILADDACPVASGGIGGGEGGRV